MVEIPVCGTVQYSVVQGAKAHAFMTGGRHSEENILHARTVESPRFLY